MDGVRIRWSGGEASFDPGTVVRIGRDPSCEVTLQNANVSRRHAELVHRGGWVLSDVGSAQGTWRDGRQVDSVDVRGTVQLTLGREGRGEVLVLEAAPAQAAPFGGATEMPDARPAAVPTGATEVVGAGGVGAGAPGTVVVGQQGDRPGGRLRDGAGAPGTVLGGDPVVVEVAGRTATFPVGRDVVIGREDDCDVRCEQPSVSRRHARLTHDDGRWTLVDQGSSGGTWVEGKRVTSRPVEGRLEATLGDPVAGERLVVSAGQTSSTGRRQRSRAAGSGSRAWAPVAAVAAAVVVVVLAGALFLGLSSSGADEDTLTRATVGLEAGDRWGSGTIVDAERGLILTNAHVVAPSATGAAVRTDTFGGLLDPNPKEVTIHVASGPDKEIEPRYVGKVVASDGYLDLAVVQITETVGGRIVEPDSGDLDGLAEVEVADTDQLRTGDELRVLGFPDAAQSSSVTLTEGVVSGPVKDERLRSNRAMLNISADVRPGNSGGLAADGDGVLVGVPSIIRDQEVPSMRPASFAVPLIERARAGRRYRSPWLRPLRSEQVTDVRLVAPGSSNGIQFSCDTGSLSSLSDGAVGVSFRYSGFEPGRHQDLMLEVRGNDRLLGWWALNEEYPVDFPASQGCATVTVPIDVDGIADGTPIRVAAGFGPDYVPLS